MALYERHAIVDSGAISVHMESRMYQCGEILVDEVNRRFTRRNEVVDLEPKVFAVILQLLARPDELMTRDQLLDAVWGHRYVTPSTLNRAIALARKAFADDPTGSAYIQTVHGAGYRYVGPIERRASPVREARATFAPPLCAQVPARLDEIIGREGEIRQIAVMFESHRAVTLLGAGGMGKTQCALEFARESASRYPDGVWFSDLAPNQQASEWLESLALSLSISPKNEPDLIAKTVSVLRHRRALLLLDNCDRISAGVGSIVVELLRRTDSLQVLATSQQQLDFVGERVLRIPPLALPPVGIIASESTLPQIASSPAVSLLVSRIQAVQSTFELTTGNALQIADICRRLDGMPLALELAAARFAMLSADQVLQRLDDRFRFLVGDVAGRDRRHQTLQALIDWSYALLAVDERRLLCWLGVFVQGWTIDVAGRLSASMGIDAGTLVDLLTGLVKKSLVVVDPTLYTPRYRLLESVRGFSLDELACTGEQEKAREAHLACMREMSRRTQSDMLSGQMRERLLQWTLEHANIDAALEWASRNAHHEAALDIAGSMMLYVKSHGAMIAGRSWCEVALANTERIRSPARARALLTRGIIETHLRTILDSRAVPWLIDAWNLARETGDEWALACASGYRALDLVNLGRADEALEFVQCAKELAVSLQDDWLRGLAGLAQGWVEIDAGEWARAIETLQAVRKLGHDLHQQHFIDMYIGLSLFALGELQIAAARWHSAMGNALQVRNWRGAAGSIEGCAYISGRRGQPAQAIRLLRAAEIARGRSQVPLFRFWLPFHEAAMAEARTAVESGELKRQSAMSEAANQEDAANEALDALARFAE